MSALPEAGMSNEQSAVSVSDVAAKGRAGGVGPDAASNSRAAGIGPDAAASPGRTYARRHLELLGQSDLPWIDELLAQLHALDGKPWREVAERIANHPSRARHRMRVAVIDAMRFLYAPTREGLRGEQVRRELLGRPALDDAARTARLEATAIVLETSPEHLLQVLWTDLAKQRIVDVKRERTAREVAAEANVRLIQRILGRCFELRLAIRGDASALVRAATIRGLLATAQVENELTELVISGPLAVFHRTTVYGRALCQLVRHLSACRRFVLDAQCDLGYGPTVFRIEAPVILPPPPAERIVAPIERRFEKELARARPEWVIERTPMAHVVRVRDQTWTVEIMGYWTPEYLTRKLASYTGNAIFCIDAARSLSDAELVEHAHIVRYERRVDVKAVIALIERGSSA